MCVGGGRGDAIVDACGRYEGNICEVTEAQAQERDRVIWQYWNRAHQLARAVVLSSADGHVVCKGGKYTAPASLQVRRRQQKHSEEVA